jgi:AcrR family transcriptional regulator
MRAVTQAAGTSVSAANYHFGSKEALLRAVLLRRVEPVNRLRLARLDEALARARDEERAVLVEEVVEALLRPTFEFRAAMTDGRQVVRQVAARLFADPPELVAHLKRELFQELADRFLAALEEALPGAPARELSLSFQLTVGLMVHVMAGHLDDAPVPDRLGGEASGPFSDEEVLHRMIAYAAAGLRARNGAKP